MKAHEIILYTNRNWMVFDADGQQMPDYQQAVSCFEIANADLARRAIAEAYLLGIAKWGVWRHEITRTEMEYLLGLRTREMDLAK